MWIPVKEAAILIFNVIKPEGVVQVRVGKKFSFLLLPRLKPLNISGAPRPNQSTPLDLIQRSGIYTTKVYHVLSPHMVKRNP